MIDELVVELVAEAARSLSHTPLTPHHSPARRRSHSVHKSTKRPLSEEANTLLKKAFSEDLEALQFPIARAVEPANEAAAN